MKKLLALMLAVALALSLAACGGAEDNNTPSTGNGDTASTDTSSSGGDSTPIEEEYYSIGDTVSTDIFEFTLDEASLTIALNNGLNDNYFTAKEYEPQQDGKNPFVAPKGHTYVAFTYTVSNLDRASAEFHTGGFAKVEYNGTEYNTGLKDGAYYLYQDKKILDVDGKQKTDKANVWHRGPSSNLLLSVGEKQSRRAYLNMSVDVDSLTDEFKIMVAVPNSDKTKTSFTYLIPAK